MALHSVVCNVNTMNKFTGCATLSALAFVTFMSGCDESPADDPCRDAVPFEAGFYIKEAVGDSLVITDKALLYASVAFEAADNYDDYEWQVGSDQNVSTSKKYTLLFTETVDDVEVRLIAKKAAGPCFPDDKTVDTVYQTFSIVQWNDAAVIGRYAGSYERTPALKDTIEIKYTETIENPAPFGEFNIININRGCNLDEIYPHACLGWQRGYRAFMLTSGGAYCKDCPLPIGLIKLVDENTIQAEITYGDTTQWGTSPMPRLADKFIGTRIQ